MKDENSNDSTQEEPLAKKYLLSCGPVERRFIIKKADDYIKSIYQEYTVDEETSQSLQETKIEINKLKYGKREKPIVVFTSLLQHYKFDKEIAIKIVDYLVAEKLELKKKEKKEKIKDIKVSPEIMKQNEKIAYILLWKETHGIDARTEYTHDSKTGELFVKDKTGENVKVEIDNLYKLCIIKSYIENGKGKGKIDFSKPAESIVNGEELNRLYEIAKSKPVESDKLIDVTEKGQ